MKMRRLLIPAALMTLGLLQASEVMALGLARARGAVLIGRPLNVTIAATVEPGDPEVPCVEADVFQGDNKVAPRRVGVRWESGTAGTGNVRVTTEGVVEEPVVMLYIRVGCVNKVTRRYVLLSEEPMEQENARSPGPVFPAPVPGTISGSAVPAIPGAGPAPSSGGTPGGSSSIAPTPAVPRSARPAASAPSPSPSSQVDSARAATGARAVPRAPAAAPAAAAVESQRARPAPRATPAQPPRPARLKLEPLDLSVERDPTLRSSGKLQSEPVADEERRRQAAAMWKALSAGPEEAMRNSERMNALEKDMRSLQDLMRKNTSAVEAMRDQTVKARTERNMVSIMAIVLGVLALVAAVWAWRSRRAAAGAAWWGRPPLDVGDSEMVSGMPSSDVGRASGKHRPKAADGHGNAGAADVDLDIFDSGPPPARPPGASRPPVSKPQKFSASSRFADFPASILPGSSRMMKAEELIDIQQQADFFLSIDQPERAITLLESHIHSDAETSALAWMDLLEIYHGLGREEDYDRVREGFHERFNAQVPPFESYSNEQGGLENYSRALSRIMSLWPSRKVLEVIEESLLRKPTSSESEAFGLEAYRELVLLYNIGREVAEDFEEPAMPRLGGFGDTGSMSLSSQTPVSERTQVLSLQPADGLPDVGLDIDLGAFGDFPPAPPPTPKPMPKDPGDTDLDALDWRSLR